jgi:hypothetical protein
MENNALTKIKTGQDGMPKLKKLSDIYDRKSE